MGWKIHFIGIAQGCLDQVIDAGLQSSLASEIQHIFDGIDSIHGMSTFGQCNRREAGSAPKLQDTRTFRQSEPVGHCKSYGSADPVEKRQETVAVLLVDVSPISCTAAEKGIDGTLVWRGFGIAQAGVV